MLKQRRVENGSGTIRNRAAVGAACTALALALHAGSALAGGGHGATIDQIPVAWQLSAAGCPNVPAGATIDGTGILTSVTTTTTVGGITTVINTSHASGNATDQLGNTYVWDYSNHYRVENSGESPDVFSGQMVDAFALAGSGPYRLSNGFLGIFTFGPGDFYSITEINSRGDPIAFGDFATNACDPL